MRFHVGPLPDLSCFVIVFFPQGREKGVLGVSGPGYYLIGGMSGTTGLEVHNIKLQLVFTRRKHWRFDEWIFSYRRGRSGAAAYG